MLEKLELVYNTANEMIIDEFKNLFLNLIILSTYVSPILLIYISQNLSNLLLNEALIQIKEIAWLFQCQ